MTRYLDHSGAGATQKRSDRYWKLLSSTWAGRVSLSKPGLLRSGPLLWARPPLSTQLSPEYEMAFLRFSAIPRPGRPSFVGSGLRCLLGFLMSTRTRRFETFDSELRGHRRGVTDREWFLAVALETPTDSLRVIIRRVGGIFRGRSFGKNACERHGKAVLRADS